MWYNHYNSCDLKCSGERGSPQQCGTKNYVFKQTISSKRASNERPYRIVKAIAKLRSGIIFF